ncbi:MAG: 4Fe-4S binding protein [Hydrogenimonas sp.]|nr:4Fe-4S binding protein [Hydrogenimonas sp.]
MVDEERRGIFTSLSSALRGGKKESNSPIRPPYNAEKDLFSRLCPDCEEKSCAGVCEEDIIEIGEDGTPRLLLQKRGCTFCSACLDACKAGVLSDRSLNFIDASVEIDILRCMAWHQSICSSCKDPCLEDAINFLGLFRPEIESQKCTACGWCISVCPTEAIKIETS